jgi:hypothetical protein
VVEPVELLLEELFGVLPVSVPVVLEPALVSPEPPAVEPLPALPEAPYAPDPLPAEPEPP